MSSPNTKLRAQRLGDGKKKMKFVFRHTIATFMKTNLGWKKDTQSEGHKPGEIVVIGKDNYKVGLGGNLIKISL